MARPSDHWLLLSCHTHRATLSTHSGHTQGRVHKHLITLTLKSTDPGPQMEATMSYLQVPDLDLRVHGSCSKNESIRMELRAGESYGEGEVDLWSEPAGRA